ncbi:tRNA-guanine transglycosylase [Legionella pneumophila]|nr:tRNA-guanine transglycosylase [Legionella pneumophila]
MTTIRQYPNSRYGYKQALFGIVQGGNFQDLRRESADFVSAMNTDGIAIGGETVGFDMDTTVEVIRWVYEYLPGNKPRYTMGVGMSPKICWMWWRKVSICLIVLHQHRNARHGALYCGKLVREGNWLKFQSEHENGRIQIKKSCFADDLAPVMESCSCYTLNYSRSYLHHLSKQKANLFTALASIHNVHVLHDV